MMGWEDESCCCGYVFTDCASLSQDTGCYARCLDQDQKEVLENYFIASYSYFSKRYDLLW